MGSHEELYTVFLIAWLHVGYKLPFFPCFHAEREPSLFTQFCLLSAFCRTSLSQDLCCTASDCDYLLVCVCVCVHVFVEALCQRLEAAWKELLQDSSRPSAWQKHSQYIVDSFCTDFVWSFFLCIHDVVYLGFISAGFTYARLHATCDTLIS